MPPSEPRVRKPGPKRGTYTAGSREELALAVRLVWGKLNLRRYGTIAEVLNGMGWFSLAAAIEIGGDPSRKTRSRLPVRSAE
jgi:hypothetical protein